MPNSRLRCKGCREYHLREQITWGFCSDECKQEHRARQQRRINTRNRRRDAEFTSALKAAVRARDGNCCRWCGSQGVHVHHVEYRSQGGRHTTDNLMFLCQECHTRAHSNKKLYQPLLRAVLWLEYFFGVHLSVPETERWLDLCE